MMREMKGVFFAIALISYAMAASGCFALFVGAAAGAGGYAWIKGELEKEFNTSAERLYKAALKGMKKLDVAVKDDKHDRISAKLTGDFADGQAISINIDAITEKRATLKIRVGVFGDKTKSEMLLDAIQKSL